MSETSDSDKFIEPINEIPTIDTLEKWEIIALPEKKCPELDASNNENINNLIERTKLEFEKNILELGANFTEINKEVEIDIRIKSNTLKDDINILESTGNKNVNGLLTYKTQVLYFDGSKFQASNDFCENLLKEGIEKIDTLHEDLQDLEKMRSDKYKKILKYSYDKMEKCSYKLPSEIQLYFEEQIIQINKIILSNLRNYKELHLNLTLTFTNIIKLLIYKLLQYEEEWKTLVFEEIKRRLRLCEYTEEDIENFLKQYPSKSIKELIKMMLKIEEDFNDPSRIDPRDLAWYKETTIVLEDIEYTVKDLLHLFEKAANELEVPKELLDWHELSKSITSLRSELKSIQDMVDEYPGEEEPKKIYTRDELEEMWSVTLREIFQVSHMKYTLLKELEHIWKSHGKRVDDIKLTITTELKITMDKNDKNFQEKHEQTLNIAIDTVRQEMNEKKLDKSMRKVNKILNKMITALNEMKLSELKVANKFKQCIENENAIVTKDIAQFLIKYSQKATYPLIKEELGQKSITLFEKLDEQKLDMEGILYHESNIISRMNEKLSKYADQQLEYADEWIGKSSEKIDKKFHTKLEFHNERHNRIKLDVVDVRIAEVKKHLEMFELHKKATENHLKNIQASVKEFEKEKILEISEFVQKLKDMSQDPGTFTTSTAAEMYVKECTTYSEQTIFTFKQSVEKFSKKCFKKINRILSSNYNFLQHIKLFHEGGNFHAKEAKMFTKKISQLETSIQKRSHLIKQELNSVQKKLIKSIEAAAKQCTTKRTIIYETLKFLESIEAKIQNIQQILKHDVYQLRYKRKKIDTIYERVKQLVASNNFSKASCVIKYCKDIIYYCNEFREYLEETNTPSRIYSVNNIVVEVPTPRAQTPKSKVSKKTTDTKASKKVEITLEDYNLYEFFDEQKFDKFMNIVNHDIQSAFLDVQDTVKAFYGLQYELDPNRIVLTFQEFMNNILPKFKYYYLQCLDIWVKEIKDFAEFCTLFLNNCEEYCRDFVHFAHQYFFNIFKESMDNYMRSIQNVEKLGYAEIRAVHDELKPLYGYPGNKELLDELNNKMDSTMNIAKQNFEVSLEPFFDYIEEYMMDYHNKMTEVSYMITSFKEHFFESYFCALLIMQAKTVVSHTNFENFPFNLMYIVGTWEEETVKYNSETDLTEIIDTLQENIRVQIMEEEARIYECQFEEIKNKYYLTWESTLETWHIDVKKVTDLYTVKYF